jgi:hypothetical protein
VTDGPDLAERQLRELVAASGGSLEVLDTRNTEGGRWFTISMYTSGIPPGLAYGSVTGSGSRSSPG